MTVTVPPSGVNFSALSSRFATTCSSRSRSPRIVAAARAPDQRHLPARGLGLDARQRIAADLAQVERRELDVEILGLELVEAAQGAEQPSQALDLVADDAQVLGSRGHDPVLERLDARLDGRQRRAQLVRQVGRHVAPPLLVAGQRVGHRC